MISAAWSLVVRFVRAWDRDTWQLAILSIPFARGLLYVLHLAPAQLNDEVIGPPWQVIALVTLGVAALLGIIGILRGHPILERLGMHLLGPFGLIYGLCSVVSDPHRGLVTFIGYSIISACCFRRARKITLHLRWVNSMLMEAAARNSLR